MASDDECMLCNELIADEPYQEWAIIAPTDGPIDMANIGPGETIGPWNAEEKLGDRADVKTGYIHRQCKEELPTARVASPNDSRGER